MLQFLTKLYHLNITKKDYLRLSLTDRKHQIEPLLAEHQVHTHIEPDDIDLLL